MRCCFSIEGESGKKTNGEYFSHYIGSSLSPDGPFLIQSQMANNDKIAVLYSWQQKAFHIETLDLYIESNMKSIIEKKDNQYKLIALYDTYEECDLLISELRS